MTFKISGRLLFSFGFVVLFVFLIWITLGYNQLARLVPMVVLIPGLFAALLQFGLDLRSAFKGDKRAAAKQSTPAVAESAADQSEEEAGVKLSPKEMGRREVIGIAWLLGFFVLIVLFGLNAAIPIFVLVFMRYFGRESWRLSVGFALACWAFVWLIFVYGLKNDMYPGVLSNMFLK